MEPKNWLIDQTWKNCKDLLDKSLSSRINSLNLNLSVNAGIYVRLFGILI